MIKKIPIGSLLLLTIWLLSGCSAQSDNAPGNTTGKAGSLAKYSVGGPNNNYLYSVSNTEIIVTDITDVTRPVNVQRVEINAWWQVETVFPFNDKLYKCDHQMI